MITLRDLLHFIGYQSELECIAYIKIMAYSGAFGDPIKYVKEQKYDSAIANKYKQFAQIASSIFPSKDLFYQDQVIEDNEAKRLLEIKFTSLEEAFVWLHNVAEIFFLRKEFFLEGINPHNEVTGINTKRWLENNSTNSQLYPYAKTLNLVNGAPWPADKKIDHLILFSNLEPILKKRMEYIDRHFIGTIDCLTGPRGLFNFESELAPILAEWFNEPSKVDIIQAVLNKYKDELSPLQWTLKLSELKKAILLALNKTQWPQIKSYYYQDKEKYDIAAKIAGHEMLDCCGGPWPVAMDLIDHYAKKHFYNYSKITLRPVIALGENGRLAGVDDLIKVWYDKFGKSMISQGKMPAFVSCNLVHTISFILKNLMYNSFYQESLLRRSILEKTHHIINQEEKKEMKMDFWENQTPLVIGPEAKEFNLLHGLDCLAKSLYSMKKEIKESIAEYKAANEEKNMLPQERYVKRIIRYNPNNYLKLSNSTLDLGIYYYRAQDLIKTSGLINFAENVFKAKNNQDDIVLLQAFYQFTLVNMKKFIALSLQKLECKIPNIDIELIRASDQINKEILIRVRKKILSKLNNTSLFETEKLIALYQTCFNEIKQLVASITQQSIDLMGGNNTHYALAFLGSNSRNLSTPYSDIESFVITANKESYGFIMQIIKLQLLKILNLGETILPAMGITGLELGKIFDNFTPAGFAYDMNCPSACKTPLGAKINGIVRYRLTGTTNEMKDLACNVTHDVYLPQLLRSSRLVCGNKDLYSEYKTLLVNQSTFKMSGYLFALLKQDLDKFLSLTDEFIKTKVVRIKNQYYRPIIMLIEALYGLLNQQAEINSYQKIQQLLKYQIINEEQATIFAHNLSVVLYVRLKQVFKFEKQETYITGQDEYFSILYQTQLQLRTVMQEFRKLYDTYDRNLFFKENSLAQKAKMTVINDISKAFFEKYSKITFFNQQNLATQGSNKSVVRKKIRSLL